MVSKSKYIGAGTKIAGTTGLLALVTWFALNMWVQMEGDVQCDGTFEDPCEWHYNVTSPVIYYIYNKNSTYIGFDPSVKDFIHCKRDGRFRQTDRSKHLCGPGWREFNWSVPLSSSGSYVEKFNGPKDKHEYKIVVLKHDPSDRVKFGGALTGKEFDPWFLPNGVEVSWLCSNEIIQTQNQIRTYKNITKSLTCPTNYFNFTTNPRIGYCYNAPVTYANGSTLQAINFSQFFNYGHVANKTIYWWELELDRSYIHYINTTICHQAGLIVGDKAINFSKCAIQCSWDNPIFQCDICNGDSNCDGILQQGESGNSVDLSKDRWRNDLRNWKVDNGKASVKQVLGDCVG